MAAERGRARTRGPLWPDQIGLIVALLIPALGMFLTAGPVWAAVLTAIGSLWIICYTRLIVPRVLLRLDSVAAVAAAGSALVALAIAVALIHPRIDTSGFTVLGNGVGAADNDDAVELGVAALLVGQNPYDQVTFLGAPIGPLPGSFALGLPFHVLGNVAYSSVAFLGVFWLLAKKADGTAPQATALFFLVLCGTPVVIYQALAGMDYITDTVAVLALAGLVIRWSDRPALVIGTSVLLGVATATRVNLLLLAVPTVATVLSLAGRWRALLVAAGVSGGFLLAVLPFYLRDPEAFTPFQAGLDKVDDTPFGAILVPAMGVGIAVALWLSLPHRSVWDFYRDAFFIQLAVVGVSALLQFVAGSVAAANFFHYGVLFLFPGVLYFWRRILADFEGGSAPAGMAASAVAGSALRG